MITLKVKNYSKQDLDALYDIFLGISVQAQTLYPERNQLIEDIENVIEYLERKVQSTETGNTRQ